MKSGLIKATDDTRLLGGLFILASLIAFATVWYAQDWLKLAPCELCLWERRPWKVLLGIGVITLVLRPRLARWVALGGLICLLTSVGLAILHAGVEHGFWPSPAPECKAPVFHGGSFSEWMASMPTRPNKPCDSPDFLFGLPVSMTELGGLYASSIFTAAAIINIRSFIRK